MKLAAGLLLATVIAGQGVDAIRRHTGIMYDVDNNDDLGITLKQAIGVGQKFQQRWNNGFLFDGDSENGRRLKGYPPLCRFDTRGGMRTIFNKRGNLPCGGKYCC